MQINLYKSNKNIFDSFKRLVCIFTYYWNISKLFFFLNFKTSIVQNPRRFSRTLLILLAWLALCGNIKLIWIILHFYWPCLRPCVRRGFCVISNLWFLMSKTLRMTENCLLIAHCYCWLLFKCVLSAWAFEQVDELFRALFFTLFFTYVFESGKLFYIFFAFSLVWNLILITSSWMSFSFELLCCGSFWMRIY